MPSHRTSEYLHWKSIDWGRPLEIWNGPDGESGHQLVTSVGRLDFLCSDRLTDALIVVELKRGRPSDKVVGQVARYIGYVRTHLAKPGQPVEGLIIAHDADDPLCYAVAAFPGLQLMTYEVTFQLKAVEEPTAPVSTTSNPEFASWILAYIWSRQRRSLLQGGQPVAQPNVVVAA